MKGWPLGFYTPEFLLMGQRSQRPLCHCFSPLQYKVSYECLPHTDFYYHPSQTKHWKCQLQGHLLSLWKIPALGQKADANVVDIIIFSAPFLEKSDLESLDPFLTGIAWYKAIILIVRCKDHPPKGKSYLQIWHI